MTQTSPLEPESQRSHVVRLRIEGFIDTRIIADLVGLRDDSLVWAAIEAESNALDRAMAWRFVRILSRGRDVARAVGFIGEIVDLVEDALCEYAGHRGALLAPKGDAQPSSEAAE